MKIDLGHNQAVEVKSNGLRNINLITSNNNSNQTVTMGLTEAVALHAALGEEIKELRKK